MCAHFLHIVSVSGGSRQDGEGTDNFQERECHGRNGQGADDEEDKSHGEVDLK